ncbi:heavy-metal-associated domain-containing protein [Candidatus Woesearchaeota archaeon]|nr:heavy-metal-associated domain-containing protein [Candidatus Woesearchaeota archaeon]
MSLTIKVKGMHCPSCKMLIEEELEDNGATNIEISFDAETQEGLVVCENIDEKKAKELIEELGDYKIHE